jgi:hypothetical protein
VVAVVLAAAPVVAQAAAATNTLFNGLPVSP